MKENSYSFEEFGIKTERFLRKYKFLIIFIIVIVIAYYIFGTISENIKTKKIQEANILYKELLLNKNDEKLSKLKELNSNLYFALLFDDKYIEELAKFDFSKEDKLLQELAKARNLNSEILLKDANILNEAYALLKDNKIKEAEIKLNSISSDSAFFRIANSLKHYQGK